MTTPSRPHEISTCSNGRTLKGNCAETDLAAAYAILGEENGVRTHENKVWTKRKYTSGERTLNRRETVVVEGIEAEWAFLRRGVNSLGWAPLECLEIRTKSTIIHDHASGRFGDASLRSARDPGMVIGWWSSEKHRSYRMP